MRLALTLVLLLATPAAAEACGPRKADTVAANRVVRVHSDGVEGDERFRACLEPRGRPMNLGRGALTDGYPENFRLAGRFVAYSWLYSDRYTGDSELFVHRVDVRRRKIREWHFNRCNCPPYAPSRLALHGIRLIRSGAFAFMAGPLTNDHGSTYVNEVWATGEVVDSGADVDLGSFDLVPGGVSWLRGGVRRSVRL